MVRLWFGHGSAKGALGQSPDGSHNTALAGQNGAIQSTPVAILDAYTTKFTAGKTRFDSIAATATRRHRKSIPCGGKAH